MFSKCLQFLTVSVKTSNFDNVLQISNLSIDELEAKTPHVVYCMYEIKKNSCCFNLFFDYYCAVTFSKFHIS